MKKLRQIFIDWITSFIFQDINHDWHRMQDDANYYETYAKNNSKTVK